MSSKHWMEKAIKKPGSLKAQAQRAGASTAEFASEHEDATAKLASGRGLLRCC
jgi:hypothetical protein